MRPPEAASWSASWTISGSDDMLLFSTDYPHWHYDGQDALPEGCPESSVQKVLVDNPLATYSRLRTSAGRRRQETAL